MIPLLLLAGAAVSAPVNPKLMECQALIKTDVAKAISFASQWQIDGGGISARECLGLAYAKAGRWQPAMTAFEQAAQIADRNQDPRAPRLWVQSGNAALAAGDANKARIAFETALGSGKITGTEAGEVWLDRGRALVALRDLKGARTCIDQALKLTPTNPLAWLLSATLARRMEDLKRAQNDIGEAIRLAPNDPAVALEAGNIAIMSGAPEAAKTAWEAAAKLDPSGPIGASARRALSQFGDAAKP
jgi:tetratricopeptide (TPR) repeat protein